MSIKRNKKILLELSDVEFQTLKLESKDLPVVRYIRSKLFPVDIGINGSSFNVTEKKYTEVPVDDNGRII